MYTQKVACNEKLERNKKIEPPPARARWWSSFVIKINSISKFVQTNYTNPVVCVARLSVCGKQKKTTSEILVIKINRSGERRRRAGRRLVGRRVGGPPSPPLLHTYTCYSASTLPPRDLSLFFVSRFAS